MQKKGTFLTKLLVLCLSITVTLTMVPLYSYAEAADGAADGSQEIAAEAPAETAEAAAAEVAEPEPAEAEVAEEPEVEAIEETEADAEVEEEADEETDDSESDVAVEVVGEVDAALAEKPAEEEEKALAAPTDRTGDITITNFDIADRTSHVSLDGKDVDHIQELAINIEWESKVSNLVEGDYFTFDLPAHLQTSITSFPLYSPDGSDVLANATLSPKSGGGYTVTVTFTDKVEGRENVEGYAWIEATFGDVEEGQTYPFVVEGIERTIHINERQGIGGETLAKWGSPIEGDSEHVEWNVRINASGKDLSDPQTTITDSFSGSVTPEYVRDSFVLKEVVFDETGKVVSWGEETPLANDSRLVIDNSKPEFTFNAGNLGNKSYYLIYRTTYIPGTTVTNTANLKSGSYDETKTYTYKDEAAGGGAQGDLKGKIKIIKVDKENTETKLPGAKFKITSKNGELVEPLYLTTDENGEAVTPERLNSDEYTIEEVEPPVGYEIDTASVTVNVTPETIVIKTFSDKPIKTEATVKKVWDDADDQDGLRPESIEVELKNGDKVVDTVTLDESNGWTKTLTNLPAYDKGQKITYTWSEKNVPEGYELSTSTEGTVTTLTNKHTPETTSLEGKKVWKDNDDQDGVRPESITINLLADGEKVDSKTVTEDDDWAWEFTGLPKNKAKGVEIKYTVTEEVVADYTTTYDGNDVINTHAPGKTSVTVVKTWDDSNNKDGVRPSKVTIKLLADGVETGDTLTLSASNQWKGSFTDLDEYVDGKKVNYTVSEAAVDKYEAKISGDAASGFVVTNKHVPKKTVPPKKPGKPSKGPKTGDESNIALYLLLLAGAASGIVYTARRKRREDR